MGRSFRSLADEVPALLGRMDRRLEVQERIPSGLATIGPHHLAIVPAARVQLSAAQTFTTGSSADLAWTSEVRDNAGLFDPGANTVMTAPITGLYFVEGGVRWTANATGDRVMLLRHSVLGDVCAHEALASSATFNSGGSVFAVILMSAGETISVRCTQTSGGNLNVLATPGTYMAMTWMGNA